MIPLIGPSQFRVVSPPSALTSADRTASTISLEDPQRLAPALPLGLAPEQVFLGHHVQDRPDVLGHPAVDQDQALGQGLVELGGLAVGRAAVEDLVASAGAAPG